MINKLISITNQLLDLGKRNRLLNFKDTGLKTLKLLNTNIEEIFRGIKNSREFPVFNTDPVLSQYHRENSATIEFDSYQSYSDELVYEVCAPLINKDVLCYKRGYALEKVLKSLSKDYKFSITEKGINSLYLSFGFIHYFEEGVEYLAPLLLIPVELDNESGFYVLREYEDEVLLNPTLKFYFNSTYKVDMPEYKDDALSTFFAKINEILPQGTFLESAMSLGIYSFYKMNMYNDLIFNKELVIQNKNIRALLGDKEALNEKLVDAPVYPVVNCDSSQLEAIEMAASGKSFCLQGPPGSGKSQTITNIISSLLGNGKKILFVSEKIAALNVVFENLRRAKLSEFAIELHSNKANKKEFIENLYSSATLPKYDVDFKTRFLEAKFNNLKSQLNEYETEIHNVVPGLGKSLLDLYSMYLNVEAEEMDFTIYVEDYNLFDLEKIESLLRDYIRYSEDIGYDYRKSALYGLNQVSETYILYELNTDLDVSLEHLSLLVELKNDLNQYSNLNIYNMSDAYKGLFLVEKLFQLGSYHPAYLDKKTRVRLLDLIETYIELNKNFKKDVLNSYKQTIINENLEELLKNIVDNNKGLFKNKEFKDSLDKVLSYRNEKAKTEIVISELEELVKLKKHLLQTASTGSVISKLIGDIKNYNLKSVISDLKYLDTVNDLELSKEGFDYLCRKYKNRLKFNEIKAQMVKLSSFSKVFDTTKYNIYTTLLDDVLEKFKNIDSERTLFRKYMQLDECIDELQKFNSLDYLNEFLSQERGINNLALEYRKLFIKHKILYIINESELLSDFRSLDEDEIVEGFRELDEKLLNINRDYIIAKNSQKRPDESIIEGSEFKILAREHEKLRRQLPIRVLLEQTFELALDIKPVFLMSPLSVSTYLACKLNMFDCVIFDEASQIFASDALGAIYRANQCIVIGDTKQMPPTAFFQAGVGEENVDTKEYDLESILDKASDTFDMTALKWHYRSRSEELITFSNQSFYDSNLITIPQSRKHESGFGIDFYYVEDGRYDTNTRTNPIEAKKVCDMVFEHFDNSEESLGVVAFSNVQAELISNLIEKRLKKNPKYEKFFDEDLDEPFFVKNLESVQGDERDRIIFSICYGYNQENKFYQRFGPLNNSGGERRLNVAITRAKFNVSVVSSIKYDDIKSTTESKGVLLLRSYLKFAQNVVTSKNFIESENGIINAVKEYLESLGYEVLPHYGSSSFKVDLAVKKDEEFVMAIMIDSKNNYVSNLTDKYRLEKLLLERLGWKYFKLYSTAWINDCEVEKARLYDALISDNYEESSKEREHTYLKVDNSIDSLDAYVDEYDEINIERAKDILKYKGIEQVIREIVEIEAPIHEDYLAKKVATILEKAKANAQIKEMIEDNIPRDMTKAKSFYYFEKPYDMKLRIGSDREIAHYYPLEIIHGVFTIVTKHNGITIDGCYKTMAQLLNYEKVTPNVKKALEEAVAQLILEKRIFKAKEKLFLYTKLNEDE